MRVNEWHMRATIEMRDEHGDRLQCVRFEASCKNISYLQATGFLFSKIMADFGKQYKDVPYADFDVVACKYWRGLCVGTGDEQLELDLTELN